MRTNIATSLPNELYPLAKDVPIPSEWLLDDDINARINNIKTQQKALNADKTYFKPERTYLLNQNSKNWKRFPKKYPKINKRGTKTNVENRHTRKQGTC